MTQRFGMGRRMLTRWGRAVAQGSTVLGIAMIGLVWASVGFHLTSERQSAERAAIENAGNLARAFEAHLSQSLHDIDRTLDIMRAYYLRDPAGFDFRAWIDNSQMADKDLLQLVVIGPDGFMRASSISSETGVDLRDREHFKVHVDSHEDRLFISKPVVGRVSGRTTIQLSRRIERPDGSFGGVILASLDPSYFARLYDSIEVGSEGYIRVIGTDGVIRAAGGSIREEPGRTLAGSRLFNEIATRRAGWFFTDSNLTDRIPRLLVYRAVKDYPLVISLGRASKEIFAAVTAKHKSYNFIAGLLTALILAAIAHSVQGRLQLDRASEKLRRQNARFHAALNNMPHGVSMYDRNGRFVVSNDRYLEMYGLPPEEARLGTSLHEVLASRMKLHGTAGDPQVLARSLLARIALGKPVLAFATTSDGRTISITNQPMADGGFVATHEDITERQRAQRELKSTKIFLDTVIENIPMPLVVKDAHTQKFIFVNHAYEEFIGRRRDQLIGLTVHDLFPLDHAQKVVERDIEALRTGNGLVKAEFVLATPRGPRIVNTMRLVVGGDDGAPGHVIAVLDDVTDRRKSEERIVHMAMHDSLTDLPNRAQFQARLREALARVERGERLAVLCLDLDNFKTINDALGH
ncbi:MAG TPA: PAS-domain containing protein, partial [Xanthobacteraceae bacterium]|nr:PAS-domain containing protein [Xanthobacteraceae bacterium]